ncbi:MAG: hypothetical protein R3A45_03990, partial [Bdellovibrionota bacterium]
DEQSTALLTLLYQPALDVMAQYWNQEQVIGDEDIAVQGDCNGGGTYTITVMVNITDVEESSFIASFSLDQKFNDCKPIVDEDFYLNGTVDSNGDMALSFMGLNIDGSIDHSTFASLEITGSDVENQGTCGLSTDMYSDYQSWGVDVDVKATVCGKNMDGEYAF